MSGTMGLAAEQLWPGDHFRRGHRVLMVDRIEVTHRAGIVVTAHRVNIDETPSPPEDVRLPYGEIVLRVAP